MEGGPPVFPAGFTCPQVLWIPPPIVAFRVQDYHLLWSDFPICSAMLSSDYAVLTPMVLLPPVWSLSSSLAATMEISFDYSSSAYLDVSVQRVPYVLLWIHNTLTVHYYCRVSPFGNLWVDGYLLLTTAYRSLSRPSSAPDAKAFALCSS